MHLSNMQATNLVPLTFQRFHFGLLLPLKEIDFCIIQELLGTSFSLYMEC